MRSTCWVPDQAHESATCKLPDRSQAMLNRRDCGLRSLAADRPYERGFEVDADVLDVAAMPNLLESTLITPDETLKLAKGRNFWAGPLTTHPLKDTGRVCATSLPRVSVRSSLAPAPASALRCTGRYIVKCQTALGIGKRVKT